MSSRGFDLLGTDECVALLGSRSFGRIGMKVADDPIVLPVFYALIDGEVVFRTDPGTKLIAAVLELRVAFEVDDVNEGWSVLVVGRAARGANALGRGEPAIATRCLLAGRRARPHRADRGRKDHGPAASRRAVIAPARGQTSVGGLWCLGPRSLLPLNLVAEATHMSRSRVGINDRKDADRKSIDHASCQSRSPRQSQRATRVEVFADVSCPFAYVGLRRLLDARDARGSNTRILVRAWPLEWINGRQLAPELVAAEIAGLRASVAPRLFRGFEPTRFPESTIGALGLAAAAYRLNSALGERLSLRLREALFEEGRDLADDAELRSIGQRIRRRTVEPSAGRSPRACRLGARAVPRCAWLTALLRRDAQLVLPVVAHSPRRIGL